MATGGKQTDSCESKHWQGCWQRHRRYRGENVSRIVVALIDWSQQSKTRVALSDHGLFETFALGHQRCLRPIFYVHLCKDVFYVQFHGDFLQV